MKLRPYQVEAVEKCLSSEGGIVAWPTGSGKTVAFSEIVAKRTPQSLILAHRDELLQQAKEKIRVVAPGLHVGIVKGEVNQIDAPVVLGSVQTLARANRLEQLVGRPFHTIIIDEAHHVGADSYDRILSAFPDALKLGFTATPFRADGRSISKHLPKVIHEKSLLQMIADQYLCDLKSRRVRLGGLDLRAVKLTGGDYNEGALGEAMEAAGAAGQIVEGWLKEGEGRKSAVFLPTVRTAEETLQAYQAAGVKAGIVHGEQSVEERRGVLKEFNDNKLKVIVNCSILLEGWDQPDLACIVIARPTKSKVLYTQVLGRGTRKFPGKDYCLILDCTGATEEHDLMTMATMMGISEGTAEGGIAKMLEEAAARAKMGDAGSPLPTEIAPSQIHPRLHWIKADTPNNWLLSIDTGMLLLQPSQDVAGWSIRLLPRERGLPAKLMWKGLEFGYAHGIAEDYVRTSGAWGLAMAGARWREGRPSEGQRASLLRMGRWREGLSKGEAADLISRYIANRRI